ncbi:amidohydrolase [Pantoea sp. S18]|uniref:amidohydrolase n=1 Tax=Pantoea sp. S18 TaxID=3019892 RepID=UPI002B217839|nr:amidohydrolase [Pantoea sp. S18]MEA5101206.1 amidohydrolase [Pantoea sp. S18]
MTDHYLLTNVRLETGFIEINGHIQGTQCDLFTIEIKDGRIVAIHGQREVQSALPQRDAGGMLMLPTLRDMHIHLDKTFYGRAWRAAKPNNEQDIFQMIALEQQLLPTLLADSVEHAQQLIALLLSKGTTVIRSHCNIDPVSGLRSLEHLLQALDAFDGQIACEIVAFPQHGLLRSGVTSLMREALALGCQWTGGLDPSKVDGDMARSLDTMLSLAHESGTGVDIHLHEAASTGIACIDYLLHTLKHAPELQGRVTLSHAYCLAQISDVEVQALGERMGALGVTLASGLPLGKNVMPLPLLKQCGVKLMTGTDSVIDHWSPFGTGSMLEKANLWAQLYGRGSEFSLNRALAIVTGDILPLDEQGARIWPLAGDAADFMLIDASCSAEVVARQPAISASYFRGQQVYHA